MACDGSSERKPLLDLDVRVRELDHTAGRRFVGRVRDVSKRKATAKRELLLLTGRLNF